MTTRTTKTKKLPAKNRDMPATVGLVTEVRDELKADIRSLDAKMDARFIALESKMDSKFAAFDAKFAAFDARFASVDSRFSEQDSKIDQVLAAVHRVQAIVEEQRSENRVMLEALHGFTQRMDRMEKRQDDHDVTLRSLIRPKNQ